MEREGERVVVIVVVAIVGEIRSTVIVVSHHLLKAVVTHNSMVCQHVLTTE